MHQTTMWTVFGEGIAGRPLTSSFTDSTFDAKGANLLLNYAGMSPQHFALYVTLAG